MLLSRNPCPLFFRLFPKDKRQTQEWRISLTSCLIRIAKLNRALRDHLLVEAVTKGLLVVVALGVALAELHPLAVDDKFLSTMFVSYSTLFSSINSGHC